MPPLQAILFFALTIISIATLVYYAVVLVRVLISRITVPTLRAGLDLPLPDPAPSLAIIVPAHNEAATIHHLVRSALAQDDPNLTLILALDRCTDDTHARALEAAATPSGEPDPRLEIITIDHCPDDWAGKVHALHAAYTRSARAQTAQLLLFADADTIFHPQLLRAALAMLHDRRLDMLSLLPALTTDRWFERIVQPATGFELVRQFPIDRLNRDQAPIRFANGQFMLFTHDAYKAVGTHTAVKDELLEDLAFARLIHKAKRRLHVLMSDDLLRCRMYDSYPAFRRGWKRIYTESARCRIHELLKNSWRLRCLGALLPGATIASALLSLIYILTSDPDPLPIITLIISCAAIATAAGALALIYRSQRTPLALVPLYPIGAWITAGILNEAARDLARDIPTEWAGRSYTRKAKQ
ncbi:MAG: glycosyltransferase [Phycisphaeraceae bacterium]|nr:MAG: glycosyltransferase [Phycisphaeraceae bacterium]